MGFRVDALLVVVQPLNVAGWALKHSSRMHITLHRRHSITLDDKGIADASQNPSVELESKTYLS